MPAKTERQRRFMGAELRRAREGKKTRTGMSIHKLREFASKSPPSGVQGFSSNPSAAGATPSVPMGFSSLPSSSPVPTAPIPPADGRVSAGGPPSAVAQESGTANRGNGPKTVRGGPSGKAIAASPREQRPSGVRSYRYLSAKGG